MPISQHSDVFRSLTQASAHTERRVLEQADGTFIRSENQTPFGAVRTLTSQHPDYAQNQNTIAAVKKALQQHYELSPSENHLLEKLLPPEGQDFTARRLNDILSVAKALFSENQALIQQAADYLNNPLEVTRLPTVNEFGAGLFSSGSDTDYDSATEDDNEDLPDLGGDDAYGISDTDAVSDLVQTSPMYNMHSIEHTDHDPQLKDDTVEVLLESEDPIKTLKNPLKLFRQSNGLIAVGRDLGQRPSAPQKHLISISPDLPPVSVDAKDIFSSLSFTDFKNHHYAPWVNLFTTNFLTYDSALQRKTDTDTPTVKVVSKTAYLNNKMSIKSDDTLPKLSRLDTFLTNSTQITPELHNFFQRIYDDLSQIFGPNASSSSALFKRDDINQTTAQRRFENALIVLDVLNYYLTLRESDLSTDNPPSPAVPTLRSTTTPSALPPTQHAEPPPTPNNIDISRAIYAIQNYSRKTDFEALKQIGIIDDIDKHIDQLEGLSSEKAKLHALKQTFDPDSTDPHIILNEAVQQHWINNDEKELLKKLLGNQTAGGVVNQHLKREKLAQFRGFVQQAKEFNYHLQNATTEALQKIAPPLTDKALVLDTNLLILLSKPIGKLSQSEKNVIAKLAEKIKLNAIDRLHIANATAIELYGQPEILPRIFEGAPHHKENNTLEQWKLPLKLIPLMAPRDRSDDDTQAKLLHQLSQASVGEAKGEADRAIVADIAFAARSRVSGPKVQATASKTPILFATLDNKLASGIKTFEFDKYGGHRIQPLEFQIDPANGAKDTSKATLSTDNKVAKIEPETSQALKRAISNFNILADITVKKFNLALKEANINAHVVGGAVRDVYRSPQSKPNDIDLVTDAPLDLLAALLSAKPDGKAEGHLKDLLTTLRDNNTRADYNADIGLLRLFDKNGNVLLDITRPKAATTRDFTFNTLSFDPITDAVFDPFGTGVEDAKRSIIRFTPTADTISEQNDLREKGAIRQKIKDKPNDLGRYLKFLSRGYRASDTTDAIVKQVFAETISDLSPTDLSLLIHQTGIKSPKDILSLMAKHGFSSADQRALFPDDVSGRTKDGTPIYARAIEPWGDPNAQTLGLVAGKTDKEHPAQPYQEIFMLAAGDETIRLHVDYSDHELPGHFAPHYHVYRQDETSQVWRKATGLSETGQPILSSLDALKNDTQYLGPRPWEWAQALGDLSTKSSQQIVEDIKANTPIQSVSSPQQDIITFDNLISMHVNKFRHLGSDANERNEQQTKLLMIALRYAQDQTLPLPDDHALLELTGSRGERLRFEPTLSQLELFFTKIGVDTKQLFPDLTLSEKIRLYDLQQQYDESEPTKQSNPPTPEKLRLAAQFAQTQLAQLGPNNSQRISTFVESFELYLTDRSDEFKAALQQVRTGKTTLPTDLLPEGELPTLKAIQSVANRLGFETPTSGAYHFLKHAAHFSASEAAYMPTISSIIESASEVNQKYNQLGDLDFEFRSGNNIVIARFNTSDRTLSLATAYTLGSDRQHMYGYLSN